MSESPKYVQYVLALDHLVVQAVMVEEQRTEAGRAGGEPGLVELPCRLPESGLM
ncbi:hypothetical protein AB0D12_17885 [Streptomyces sp. NPDC048479]|uniref:hypothetical protein n=1 Tax=Streptomyces sp. NPDC048479 TaxID=3154725 RepID=UPI00343EB478